MHKFVAEQSVQHFVHILESEPEGDKRRTVQALLIAQLDQFGTSERLTQATIALNELERRIERQRTAQIAGSPLSTMLETLDLLMEYRRRIIGGLEPHPMDAGQPASQPQYS